VLHGGYTDHAVIPVKGDVPTIGVGTTTGVKLGDTTAPPMALARALTDVQPFEGVLKACVAVPLADPCPARRCTDRLRLDQGRGPRSGPVGRRRPEADPADRRHP
jgi:hypothetical protein